MHVWGLLTAGRLCTFFKCQGVEVEKVRKMCLAVPELQAVIILGKSPRDIFDQVTQQFVCIGSLD